MSRLIPPSEALQTGFVLPDVDYTLAKHRDTRIFRHGFRVGGLGLLIDTEHTVSEVFDALPMCTLPNTPIWMEGMANRRGNILPVFNMAELLGINWDAQNKHRRILVCGEKDESIGMIINGVPEKIVFSGDEILNAKLPNPEILRPFMIQVYRKVNRYGSTGRSASFLHP